ncbi:MAG: glycosyltransferase family 4 protein [Chloroflexaceae bacterium]|nr:glycosyltransferase family 4 protein [Chloroflexaceae bacterium]
MRIGIDTRYVSDHFPGIGRYVANLVRSLSRLDHPHTLVLLTHPALPNTRHSLDALRSAPNIEWSPLPMAARPFSLAEHLLIPRRCRVLRLDLLHSPYYLKPYAGLPCPSVVTIYDLIGRRFPSTLPARTRSLFNLATWLALRTSAHVLTISSSARDDIITSYRVPETRLTVTHLAADQRFCPQPPEAIAAVRAAYHLPPRYVLYLGANKPHKNLERLVLAWAQLHEQPGQPEACLVMAGHEDPRYSQARRIVAERGLSGTTRFLPNVNEADLPGLYGGADFFAFPSFYEGFGLPPLEAMACGTPVLCANASSLPEVVGDAALLVNPSSVSDLASGLQTLLTNPLLRADLRQRGLQQAQTFSWERTARKTLAVYEAVGQRHC